MEKAGLIGLVKLRFLSSDDNLSLRGDKLQEAITADRKSGYIPFFVSPNVKKALYAKALIKSLKLILVVSDARA